MLLNTATAHITSKAQLNVETKIYSNGKLPTLAAKVFDYTETSANTRANTALTETIYVYCDTNDELYIEDADSNEMIFLNSFFNSLEVYERATARGVFEALQTAFKDHVLDLVFNEIQHANAPAVELDDAANQPFDPDNF